MRISFVESGIASCSSCLLVNCIAYRCEIMSLDGYELIFHWGMQGENCGVCWSNLVAAQNWNVCVSFT